MSGPTSEPNPEVQASTQPMFDRIARRYDALNRLLSMGLDIGWRDYLARLAQQGPVLDVACGTGDVALALLRRHPDWEVIGLDPTPGMLEIARRKSTPAANRGGSPPTYALGAAEAIPYPACRFGTVTIAFGIRNVDDRPAGLREMARTLAPGGRLLVMEFGDPPNRWMRRLHAFYMNRLLPRIAGWFSEREAYRYLVESTQAFPSAERFCAMMSEAGLEQVRVHRLTLGVVNVYVGEKPADVG
jgi:demethylmenaquinone methyltransferase / 2-methoxy-6-polyprenyl-1,4-benzoquinol methylase